MRSARRGGERKGKMSSKTEIAEDIMLARAVQHRLIRKADFRQQDKQTLTFESQPSS
jgi:hypothetical protein